MPALDGPFVPLLFCSARRIYSGLGFMKTQMMSEHRKGLTISRSSTGGFKIRDPWRPFLTEARAPKI